MRLLTLIFGAVLGLVSTSSAMPAEVVSTPAIDQPLVREPGPDPSDGTKTTIVATILSLPGTFTGSLLGSTFPGVVAVTGTTVAPLDNGPATFGFLTSTTNEFTGTTITQTANGVSQSLTVLFTTPVMLGAPLINDIFVSTVEGLDNLDSLVEMMFECL